MALEDEIKQQKFKSEYNKLIVNIMFTNNWLQGMELKLLKPFGLTVSQYNVLRILRGQKGKPATINLIIERMLDRMSNASRIVDRLETKGFVTRKTCKNDRRAVDVFITDKGIDVLSEMDTIMTNWEKRFHKLSKNELTQFNKLLDKLRTCE